MNCKLLLREILSLEFRNEEGDLCCQGANSLKGAVIQAQLHMVVAAAKPYVLDAVSSIREDIF